ncbi:MAG: YjaG family protein [Colwellia sp.]|nr:YjaG family protein [Colwellia sp.]MCW8866484.1 YjaG family protein [Colwellia sp.]MCW9080628.1 YjaG family protein [Colwellia sp.]
MAIHLPFAKLSHWHQIAFSAALLERMLPNYQMFSETAQFGDFSLIRNQLDLIWQWLDKNQAVNININAQLSKLEEQTPDPQEFDFFGVFPALDVCMALMSLWQLIQSHGKDKSHDDVMSISKLSHNSVSYYVELLLIEEDGSEEGVDIEASQINAHPLMAWEKDTQNELFDFLKLAAENKRSCQLAKALVLSEGLSNLGIEIS